MSKRANPKLIGSFVLGAIVLMVAGVVVFGSGRLFRDADPAVMYFRGSVQGLNVGAPVTFRGVTIGEVTEIDLRLDTNELEFYMPVFVDFFPEAIQEIGDGAPPEHSTEVISGLIDKGLRARLVPLSLVTGQLSIQLDLVPGSEAEFVGADPEFAEFPTIPSTFEKLETVLIDVAQAINKLDLEGMSTELRETVKAIRDLATKPEISQLVDNANASFGELELLINRVNKRLDPLMASAMQVMETTDQTFREGEVTLTELRKTLGEIRTGTRDARDALAATRSLMATAQDVIQPDSPLYFQMLTALQEVALTARSLRNLLDEVEQNPNLLLFGRSGGETE